MLRSSGRRPLARNLAILAIGEALTRGLTFVAFVHLARVLKPDIFGLVELTLAVIMFCTLIVEQGFPTLGAREVARNPHNIRSLVRRIVSTQIVLAFVTYVLLTLLATLLPIGVTLRFLLLGYGVSLAGIPFLLMWVFQGRNQMHWVALPQVLRQLMFASVVLLLIHASDQILLLPLAEIVAIATAASVFVAVYRRSEERLDISLKGWDRGLLEESLPMGGSQIIWVLRMYLPIILLGLLLGHTAVGFFGVAHRIVMVVQTMLGVYFINLFPSMTQASHSSPERLMNLLHRSLPLVTWPTIGLALAMTFVAPMVISLIFGEHYMQPEAIAVLAILMWMIPILAWRRHSRSALFTLNRQREEFVCSLLGVVVLVVLFVPMTHKYGAIGSAWAMVVSELVATMLTWWRLRHQMPSLRLVQPLLRMP